MEVSFLTKEVVKTMSSLPSWSTSATAIARGPSRSNGSDAGTARACATKTPALFWRSTEIVWPV